MKHPKARRAVVAALGNFRGDEEISKALAAMAKSGDASGFVEGELGRALGRLRGEHAVETLTKLMGRVAFQDAVRVGAIDGFAELKDPRGWQPVLDALAPGQPVFGRRAAIIALAKLAEPLDKKTEAVELIGKHLRDENFRVRLAAIGIAAGCVAALAAAPLLAKMLYGVSPRDPVTFLCVALLMMLVALAASYIPARRATRIDPLLAVRHE